MPSTDKIRKKGFTYHHKYESVSREDIIRDIFNALNNRMIGLHQSEPDVAFIQANYAEFPVRPSGTVYQMCLHPISLDEGRAFNIPRFTLRWRVASDGVKHYTGVEIDCSFQFKDKKWSGVDSIDEVKEEFDEIPDFHDMNGMFTSCLTEEQKAQ